MFLARQDKAFGPPHVLQMLASSCPVVLCSCFVRKVVSSSAWPGSCPDRLPSQAPVQFGVLVLDSGCLSRGLCPTLGIGIHRDLK